MAYQAPNTYARFVRSAGPVNNPGATRVMGLIGTGINEYHIESESVLRSRNKAYDKLKNDFVKKIELVSTLPIINGKRPEGVREFIEGTDYELSKCRRYIIWKSVNGPEPTIEPETSSSQAFAEQVIVNIDNINPHLAEDEEFNIILEYIGELDSQTNIVDCSLRIIRKSTSASIERVVSTGEDANASTNIIPGFEFKISNLMEKDEDGNNKINAGDSIIIKTSAGETDEDNSPEKTKTYYVTYSYEKTDYNPKIFFDYDDVVAEYGNYQVAATGDVTNSLSLGAEIAFQNGLGPIVCVQSKGESEIAMKDAIDKLKRSVPGVNNVNVIIPLTVNENVCDHAIKHVEMMSDPSESKERMTYLGTNPHDSINEYFVNTKAKLDSGELNNERVVLVVPDGATKSIRDLNTGKVVERMLPGCYPAIAVAALGLRNDPAEPLTNKFISGFNRISKIFTETEMNMLAGSGALILEQVGSMIKVRHGITTSTDDINTNEITLIQIKDYVIEACRTITAQTYIGVKNRPSIVADVQYTITSILNEFISQEIILGYQNLKVSRNADNPTQIDVRFEIEAVYPLNYINITFGFAAVAA